MNQLYTTSVIIPCHNVENTLDIQLESLSLQRGADPFEVIIVDNKSTDDTVKIAQEWEKHLNLRVVSANNHAGVAYARNVGVKAAGGEKLIFIDGDDALPIDYVAFGQRSLDVEPVYVSGFDPVNQEEFEHGLEHVLSLIQDKCLKYKNPLPMEQDPEWPILPGCSFGILKSVFLEIGGFDLATEPGAEDNDLAIRLLEAGYSLPVQRSTTIAYRVDNEKLRPLQMYYKRADSVALLMTYADRWVYQIRTSGHPFANFAKASLAGIKVLKNPSAKRNWQNRVSTSAGIARGYLVYELLKQVPERRIGIGL